MLKKLGYSLFILWSVVTVVFFMFRAAYPNPEEMALGEQADEATRKAMQKELGLDQPVGVQYLSLLNDLSPLSFYKQNPKEKGIKSIQLFTVGKVYVVLKGPYFRRSFQTLRPVTQILGEAFIGTASLAVFTILFATVLGIFFGLISALFYNTWIDQLLLTLAVSGVSVPSFFSAAVLSWLFGYVWADYTHLSMTGNWYDIDVINGGYIAWGNFVLPVIALGIRPVAIITQLTRNSMLEENRKEYIRTAFAKGLSSKEVYWKHALPNAINPVVTSVSGWFASLLAGAFFVEYIFNWKGLGKVIIDSLERSDFPVLMGGITFVAALFIGINVLVDKLYAWIDPRIRLQ